MKVTDATRQALKHRRFLRDESHMIRSYRIAYHQGAEAMAQELAKLQRRIADLEKRNEPTIEGTPQ